MTRLYSKGAIYIIVLKIGGIGIKLTGQNVFIVIPKITVTKRIILRYIILMVTGTIIIYQI